MRDARSDLNHEESGPFSRAQDQFNHFCVGFAKKFRPKLGGFMACRPLSCWNTEQDKCTGPNKIQTHYKRLTNHNILQVCKNTF